MTAHDRFFQEKQAAAVLKHGILKRYPTVFTAKTGSKATAGRVVYLDGFAGPGRYKPEQGQTEGAEGSPLLAMRTAAAVEGFRRTLHCVFVERDARHVADLQATLAREAPPSMVYQVFHGDVSEHLEQVLALAQDSPLLAFLDPFGTGLPYTEMTGRLLARPHWPPTEVLLNFNLQSVWRIGGLLAGEDPAADAAELNSLLDDSLLDEEWLPIGGGAEGTNSTDRRQRLEASLERIDAFLGDDWWREVFCTARKQAKNQGERAASARAAQQVAHAYCDRIQQHTGYRAFTVPIRREPSHEPLFMMILFYRHAAAPFAFNNAVSKANEEWRAFTNERALRQQAHTSGPEDLFGGTLVPELLTKQSERAETQLNQGWINTIADNIAALIAQRSQIIVQDDIRMIYGDTLGLARETHLTRAWDQLSDRGLVHQRRKGTKIEKQVICRV